MNHGTAGEPVHRSEAGRVRRSGWREGRKRRLTENVRRYKLVRLEELDGKSTLRGKGDGWNEK